MIEVELLSKRYGSLEAVKDLSFILDSGQVLGLLGPNGAGKTTILKILTGFHFPTSGKATIAGFSVEDDPIEVKKRVGYLPENAPLYTDRSVVEYLSFMADARGLTKSSRANSIEKVLHDCGLMQYASKRIETLSKGFRQRLGLAQALLHDPELLILDEPTNGLDPNQILEIRSLIRNVGKKKTVILSTHILQEAEAVCNRVLILNQGRIAAQGTSDEIASSLKGGLRWEILVKGANSSLLREKLKSLGKLGRFEIGTATGPTVFPVSLFISSSSTPFSGETIFDWALSEKLILLSMSEHRANLEDLFVQLTSIGDQEGTQE